MSTTASASVYIPVDRRKAIARGEALPDRTTGAALFADVSGFTPLTEALVKELGPRRGAEELTRHLNAVYGALIDEVHRYGGSVVSFAGDAITCWFDGDDGFRATACAQTLQHEMVQFADLETRSGGHVSLAIKAAVAVGPVRRFLIGDPEIQLLDVPAGSTLDCMARAEKHADKHEVVVCPTAVSSLADRAQVGEWREDGETGERFALVRAIATSVDATQSAESGSPSALSEDQVRPWILPPIYERLEAGQERFLAELRPGLALFMRFGGLEYETDEDAGGKLDAYVRWVQNVLARYEGYLLQLIVGDKGCYLYAAFGAPLAHDDDAARAVAAALELHAPPPPLSYIGEVQIGISQGQMRAGAYGGPARRTYGVLGDEVTAAARLMQKAVPGQTLVSSRVADAAGRHYTFDYLGEVQLKGKALPMPAYAPVERRAASRDRPAAAYSHPLVGRDAELAQMAQVLELAIGGRGQILRLQGAVGVGKSHLSAEFLEMAARRGARVAVGACQSTGQGIAYLPWQQAFRALFDLAGSAGRGGDAHALTRQQVGQVEEAVRGANPGWLLRLPLLGDLLGLPIPDNEITSAFDPQLRQESLFALAVEIVQTWAGRQPVLLLVEDAHWMDEASEGLTGALGRALADVPVLLVLVQRPPVRQRELLLPELDQLDHSHLIDLNVLSAQGVEALVTDRLEGSPSPLVLDLVQAQAQGNPLFTEELVGTLRESERIYCQDDGTWTLSEPMLDVLRAANCLTRDAATGQWMLAESAQLLAADLGIPDSVHGIVLSRIDRLPERHKLTLKVASVIGRTFELALLTRAHPLRPERATLAAEMGTLEGRGFARLDTAQPQLAYQFRHNITQEVVYQTLLEAQQHELHQSVGEALEDLLPDAVERLAYHYSRSDVRDKTLRYLGLAAQKTQREYANETALNYYNQALGLEERWPWRQGQIEVLHVLGRREEEREGLAILDASPEAPAFDVAYGWGQYYEALGDYAQAQDAVERAIVACQDCDDSVGQARGLAQLGLIARRQGDYERAKEWYSQALGVFEGQDAYTDIGGRTLVEALIGLGTVYRQLGDFDQAMSGYERALRVSQESGDRQREAQVLNDLGGAATYRRRFDDALTYLRQSLEIRRAIGDRPGEGISLYNLALGAISVGDYGRAEAYYWEALAIQQAIGNRWEEGNIWNGLGDLYRELGDLSRAQDCLEHGLALTEEIGDVGGQTYIRANLGLVMRDQGDWGAAERILSDGLALAREHNDRYTESYFVSHLAITSLEAGHPERAIEQAGAALSIRRELGLHLWATADLATLAAAKQAVGTQSEALDFAQQALDVLAECGGEGPELPHRDYYVCYQVLAKAGQQEGARAALQRAYALTMARADKVEDPAIRQSILERVPINRQIVQEAASKGIID